MLDWTKTLSNNITHHHAQTADANLTVYERSNGIVTWTVYDCDDREIVAGGKSASVDKAKAAAEAAA